MFKDVFDRVYNVPLVAWGGYCVGIQAYSSAVICAVAFVVCLFIEFSRHNSNSHG